MVATIRTESIDISSGSRILNAQNPEYSATNSGTDKSFEEGKTSGLKSENERRISLASDRNSSQYEANSNQEKVKSLEGYIASYDEQNVQCKLEMPDGEEIEVSLLRSIFAGNINYGRKLKLYVSRTDGYVDVRAEVYPEENIETPQYQEALSLLKNF